MSKPTKKDLQIAGLELKNNIFAVLLKIAENRLKSEQQKTAQPDAFLSGTMPTKTGETFSKLQQGESVLPQSILNKPKFNKANFDTFRGGIFCNNTRMPDPTLRENKQENPDQFTTKNEQESPKETWVIYVPQFKTWVCIEQIRQSIQSQSDPKQATTFSSELEAKQTISKLLKQFPIYHFQAKQIMPPNPAKSALNKLVLSHLSEIETLLHHPTLGEREMSIAVCVRANNLRSDLQDFRRKVLDLGAVEPSEVELKEAKQDNPKQDSPTLSELEQGKVWIIQTNPKKVERLNAFYLEKVSADGLVIHTPNSSEALQFSTAMEAQIKAANIISCAGGRYKSDDFKIVAIEAKQPENEAD